MNPSTQREMLTNAIALGAIFSLVMYFWTRDIIQAAVMAVIMSVTSYVGYWVSNRVTGAVTRRWRPPPPPTEPLAATTERPEHAQRRRSRRRPRGRQGPNRD
jgi:hypothetical protein